MRCVGAVVLVVVLLACAGERLGMAASEPGRESEDGGSRVADAASAASVDRPDPTTGSVGTGAGDAAALGDGALDAGGEAGAPGVLQVSVGLRFGCALTRDGRAHCWGSLDSGVIGPAVDLRPPDERFTQLDAGEQHVCAVRDDASVSCWGYEHPAVTDAPAGRFTKVSVAGYSTQMSSCGLLESGEILCWGDPLGAVQVPAGPYLDVATGPVHACGLTPEGAARCWGERATDAEGPFRRLAATHTGTCGVRVDGALECWGTVFEQPVPRGTFAEVTLGLNHACALGAGGDPVCWGSNYAGQLDAPQAILRGIDAGGPSSFSCGIDLADRVRCWDGQHFTWAVAPPPLGAMP